MASPVVASSSSPRLVRAQGARVWDDQGREYLDVAWNTGLGHNHPRLVTEVQQHVGSQSPTRVSSDDSMSLFTSASDARQASLRYAQQASRRIRVLTAGDDVAFGDLAALHVALSTKKYAAFVVEPMQVEAGMRMLPMGYLAEAQVMCTRYGTILVVDESRIGLGRTGTLYSSAGDVHQPDVLILGDSLGGGIVPVGAVVSERFALEAHHHSLASVAARETLSVIEDESLLANARARGKELLGGLREKLTGHPKVVAVRGQGLLVGLELGRKKSLGAWLVGSLREHGILARTTQDHSNVVRIAPPLSIDASEVKQVVEAVDDILDDYPSFWRW